MRFLSSKKPCELLSIALGTGIATYALHKYLKSMTDKEKPYGAYYQPDRLSQVWWQGNKRAA